jgi:4-hydroxy-4-methyl-2-oxoglutarate aldolase
MSMKSILQELAEFDSALLANTLGYTDPTPAEELYMSGEIQSVTPTIAPSVGIAVTAEMDTSTPGGKADAAGYWTQLDQMAAMGLPSIWVVKAVGSRPDHECIIGDGMAKTLKTAGCVALVTDGRVRDVAGLLTTGFAAYSKGVCIHHCALRVTSINKPVSVGGLTVNPGDVIHANHEGVIKIPKGALEGLPAKATQMRAFEHDAHRLLRQTDLSHEQKKAGVVGLIAKYGFADCVTK